MTRPRRLRIVVTCIIALSAASSCSPDPPAPGPRGAPRSGPQVVLEGRGDPPTFAVVGDWGTGSDKQRQIGKRICDEHDRSPLSAVFTTGDNIYPVGDPGLFGERFFEPFACILERRIPFHAALGNHDVKTDGGKPQLEEPRFGMPARNYTVRLEDAGVVVLDSNDLDLDFVRRSLRRLGGARWTIVVLHHPVYSPGPHGPTAGFAEKLGDLFADRGVDLVFQGHDHLYAAVEPVRGVRYVVTGGGGAKLYECMQEVSADPCLSVHHFLLVAVGDDRLVVRAVDRSGELLHRFATRGI